MDEIKSWLIGAAVVFFIIVIGALNPVAIVGVGERGVKETLGKVSPESYTEGVHLMTPFVQKMHKMYVKTQKSNIKANMQTKDIQMATVTYVINYNLDPAKVHKMYREVGKDYKEVIIQPIALGIVKDVIGKWNAQDLIANREKAASEIQAKLEKQLKEKYVIVSDFSITDIQYSEAFMTAIENKVKAEQEALQAKNKTVQVAEEAKQKLLSAEAEAKSMSIRANALTKNKALVEYEAVKKWDGKLPTYSMGSAVPFINLK